MTTEQTAPGRTEAGATATAGAVVPPSAPAAEVYEWAPVTAASRSGSPVRIETEAAIAGIIAGVLGAIFGGVSFVGSLTPIWGGWSVGAAAVSTVVVTCLVASVVGYWRSRTQPDQRWRLGLPVWKFVVDTAAVAVVHVAIAAMVTFGAFSILQNGFRGLLVDGYAALIAVGVATGLATYAVSLSVSKLTTVTMSQLLVVFMTIGTFASMAISTDPHWWRYHFSHLGTFGDRGSSLFNVTLIVAGILVTTFALYVARDLRLLHDRGRLRHRWAAKVVSTLFVMLGLALAGIGAVPINVSVVVHNVFSSGASIVFALLLLSVPIALRGMPWQFFVVTAGFFVVLLAAGYLHFLLKYFNLTAFELVAYIILFGWIAVFVRFLAAVLRSEEPAAA
ncbi:DUF998 domain-containing protein [Labedella endophytica]|uniref:DUF998 domain-containing protein n=1 Tax=Labedella endophytica TaxID=1523160 RepID=A0A433JXB8_9MICO|nr:DUF998 domain-containing protein [Labedella endophytica]RUR03593.1 DUF998 domain-containing protein [Labedella endophytica]